MSSTKYGAVKLKVRVAEKGQNWSEDEELPASSAKMSSFMEDFNPKEPEFWEKVHQMHVVEKKKKKGRSWFECLDESRADRIVEKYDTFDMECQEGVDVVVLMMTDWFDLLETDPTLPFGSGPQALASYERTISKLARIIIKREYAKVQHPTECRYAKRVVEQNGVGKTLLHLAAEGFKQRQLDLNTVSSKRDFSDIAKCLLEFDPDLIFLTTHPKVRKLPVELALENYDDEMASLLINATTSKSRIRNLFQYNDDRKKLPPFKFKDYIEREDMKKTVVAVLDSLINPDWPMLPADHEEICEKEWHRVPDLPLRYHFYYQILDGDDFGRAPWDDDFSYRSTSALQAIVQSKHNKTAIQHPVIRQLADVKWAAFGESKILKYAARYLLFLLVLSVALLGAVEVKDPTKYSSPYDMFRAVCEVLTLFFAGIYLFVEIDQLEKERMKYIYDPFNWLDAMGIVCLFVIVPLRFAEMRAQWFFATYAYIFNFLRIFKFFPANKSLSLYSKVLYGLLVKEMRVFVVVYLVFLFAFSGGIYLALRATTTFQPKTGFAAVGVTGFPDILLRGTRALTEGNPFAEGYDSFNAFVIVIILASMLTIIVFLLNILIAQLSSTYESQLEMAQLEFDIDKALLVTRLENSRFKFRNLRIKYFKEGEFVNDFDRVKDLVQGWDVLHPEKKNKEEPPMFKST